MRPAHWEQSADYGWMAGMKGTAIDPRRLQVRLRRKQRLAEENDLTKNIGIRMVFKIARDVQYQNILGLNVLTIRI